MKGRDVGEPRSPRVGVGPEGGPWSQAICMSSGKTPSPSEPPLPCTESGDSPSRCLPADTVNTRCSTWFLGVNNPGVLRVPISQMRKLRDSRSREAAQDHASGKRQSRSEFEPWPWSPDPYHCVPSILACCYGAYVWYSGSIRDY